MQESKLQVVERVRPGIDDPISANTSRVKLEKDQITLEFGQMTKNNSIIEVDIISKVGIKPTELKKLVLRLYMAGVKYQKEFGESIGFPDLENEEDNNGGE